MKVIKVKLKGAGMFRVRRKTGKGSQAYKNRI